MDLSAISTCVRKFVFISSMQNRNAAVGPGLSMDEDCKCGLFAIFRAQYGLQAGQLQVETLFYMGPSRYSRPSMPVFRVHSIF